MALTLVYKNGCLIQTDLRSSTVIRIRPECVQGDFAVDRTISTVVVDDEALVAVAMGYLAGRIGASRFWVSQ